MSGDRAGRPSRLLTHPLCGADVTTLARLLIESRGVAIQSLPQAVIAVLVTGLRWPSTTVEAAITRRRLRTSRAMPPPVFIIGHWRSGTTHLQNILAHGDFGSISPLAVGLPWDLLGLGRLLRPLLEQALPQDRFIDAIPVTPTSPQEDELALANMTGLSYYHAIYFPDRFEHRFNRGVFLDGCDARIVADWQRAFTHFLGKVWLQQGRRRLLIKNPVYTARIAMLRTLYPGAKFIHVRRNPFEIFVSTRHFYRTLFEQLALQPWDGVDIDSVILRTYSRMMAAYLTDSRELPPGTLAEVCYEDLERDPLGTVEGVYRTLDLPGFEAAHGRFEAYVRTIRSYRRNHFHYPDDVLAKVANAWAPFLSHWNYAEPLPVGA